MARVCVCVFVCCVRFGATGRNQSVREIMEQAEVGREQFDLGSNVDYAFCTMTPKSFCDHLSRFLTHVRPATDPCDGPYSVPIPTGVLIVLASGIVRNCAPFGACRDG